MCTVIKPRNLPQMVPYLGKSIEVVETRGGGGDGHRRRVLAVAAGTAARPEAVGHEGRQVAPSLLAVGEFNGRKSSLLQNWAKSGS